LVQLSALPVDENGVRLAQELLAEHVLRMYFESGDERLTNLVPSLLGLSVDDLEVLLSQLPELSVEELLGRL
ncbi:MAG TPA: flagellar assembly protein H, partial [Cyanobacteria bacterium UBA11148]|nr:flagellar assembly protein H [Cyanobacteria bacterium UBA11148]